MLWKKIPFDPNKQFNSFVLEKQFRMFQGCYFPPCSFEEIISKSDIVGSDLMNGTESGKNQTLRPFQEPLTMHLNPHSINKTHTT